MPRMSKKIYEKNVERERKIQKESESQCPKCGYYDPAGRSLLDNGGCPGCDNWEDEEDDRL